MSQSENIFYSSLTAKCRVRFLLTFLHGPFDGRVVQLTDKIEFSMIGQNSSPVWLVSQNYKIGPLLWPLKIDQYTIFPLTCSKISISN